MAVIWSAARRKKPAVEISNDTTNICEQLVLDIGINEVCPMLCRKYDVIVAAK